MNLMELVFGADPRERLSREETVIDRALAGVEWHAIRPRGAGAPVRAWLAADDTDIETDQGILHATAGRDMIVDQGRKSSVVRADIFQQTYESIGEGRFRKRADLALRYFTLDYPVTVRTLEGEQRAETGDWIIEGVEGELWPVPAKEAKAKYMRLHMSEKPAN